MHSKWNAAFLCYLSSLLCSWSFRSSFAEAIWQRMSGLFALEPLGRNKCKMIQLKVHHKGSSINKTCLNKPQRNHENNSSAWLWMSQTGLTLISLTSGTVKMAEKLLSARFLVQVDQSPECRNVYRDTSSIKIRNRVTIIASLQVGRKLC